MSTTPQSSPLDAQKRTVLVTGGSRGIGQAIAQTLAQDGFQVILTYNSNPEAAANVVAQIHELGGQAAAFKLDIGEAQAIRDFFAQEIKNRVNLYGLVNNAGITKDGLLLRMKEEDFSRVIDVCLKGTFIASQEAAKIMTKNRIGRIVNLASVVGLMGNPGQANYVAAKAGIIGLTKTCAKELAVRQITCNAIAPGFIETDMTEILKPEMKDSILKSIPLGRIGKAEEVAKAVMFFAGEDSAYITGQVLAVDGGMTMC